MRTDEGWREFAEQMLVEHGGGSPAKLGRLLGVSHTTARRWATQGIIPEQGNLEAISRLTEVPVPELWEIIQRSRPVQSVTLDSLPAAVQEIVAVTLRMTGRQQREVLQFAQFRAEQAQ